MLDRVVPPYKPQCTCGVRTFIPKYHNMYCPVWRDRNVEDSEPSPPPRQMVEGDIMEVPDRNRLEFEAWSSVFNRSFERHRGRYNDPTTARDWKVWCAARGVDPG